MKTAAKDFKMTELGPIPKDWDVKRLGDCCSITTGHKDVNEGCENGHFPFFTCSRDVYRANCYSFDGEAILVAGNGDVGNLHYCNGKFEAYQRTYVLMNFKIDTQYLWCELGANLMERLTDGKIGTSIPYIVLGQLQDYMFALPSLSEQRKIAAALSDVDEMIAALEKLIEKKRKIKTGAMQRLLTGKTRLPGFKGAWVEKRLGDCATMFAGGTPSSKVPCYYGGEIPWVSISDISVAGKYLGGTENTITEEGLKNSSAKWYPPNTLLFAMYASIGKCCIARESVTSSQAILGIYDLHEFDLYFLYYTLSYRNEELLAMGQTGTQANLSKEIVSNIIIRTPSALAEQKAIAKVLGDMDEEIAALEAELAKTRQLKQGMMQELLTGKVRLKRTVRI